MPENAIIREHDRFERITTDVAYLAQFLRETRQITEAAREVLRQRYNIDSNGTFARDFPGMNAAIFQLGNLVGIPPRDRGALACQQKHEASQSR
jgi:hypothetical protein